jgi:hypothetical protein
VNSMMDSTVIIQTSSHSVPSTPCWFGEAVIIAQYLRRRGVLVKISERVRFARRRFGRYEVIDFVAVLLGYAISGERTLEAFYERVHPFAAAFMALFGRERLPARSTLSRFLAALTPEPVETLRSLFLEDLLARQHCKEEQLCGLTDRAGNEWKVFDIDGTREAARQRALPQTAQLPLPQRRLDKVCAPGYTGRKRGEIVRTRTTVLQAHSYQWLGTFGNPGNGKYREELRRVVETIGSYLQAHQFPKEHALLRLDGLYGTGAVLADLLGFAFVMRGKDYRVLDQSVVQARLHLPADQQFSRPESDLVRTLYDCPDVIVGPSGQHCRIVVATHPAGPTKKRIGVERDGLIYELFLTKVPQQAFTTSDVVALYLHRGAFEITLSDEDTEQEPDRWCSQAAYGQEAWQIVAQWIWNLRLELGHQLDPEPIRTTEFAPALPPAKDDAASVSGYAPAEVALPFKQGRFSGHDFVLQSDGTLRCPAGQALCATEERREGDGTLRLVYAARISHCRGCQLREQCQWNGANTQKPRRVSVLLHPLPIGSAPLLWKDWSRRQHRRACIQLLRHQRVDVHQEQALQPDPATSAPILSRAQRAHYRLSWEERLACNAVASTTGRSTITLFGVPEEFATSLGLLTA